MLIIVKPLAAHVDLESGKTAPSIPADQILSKPIPSPFNIGLPKLIADDEVFFKSYNYILYNTLYITCCTLKIYYMLHLQLLR